MTEKEWERKVQEILKSDPGDREWQKKSRREKEEEVRNAIRERKSL